MRPGATSKETPSRATMPPKRTATSCTRSNARFGACPASAAKGTPPCFNFTELESAIPMSEAAPYAVRDGVAVITLNNPPVNGLGNALRAAIRQGLQRAAADAQVRVVVLIGSQKAFSGGADIREFGKRREKPALPDVNDFQDAMKRPLVAAIGGFALGGGLELALACHYRIAAPKAQLGLPEVKLGILPGSGGTQRLPRIVPVAKAIEMMTTGNPIASEVALQLGLVDEIVQNGDLLEAAVVYANQLVAESKPLKRIRDLQAKADGVSFAKVRDEVAKASRGYPAPLEIVACVEAAVTKPFDEGRRFERDRFAYLVGTNESKALRHAFFAERQTSKIPDVPEDTPTRTVKKAAVIGPATMGAGIALSFVNAGIPVTITDTTQEALDLGLKKIKDNYATTESQLRLKQDEMERGLSLLRPTTDLGHLKDADIVVEAVFERMDVKQDLFRKLDGLVKPGAILATNTSTLDVNQIAAATRRPQDVIGTHFFSPANVMRLLEVVRGAKTGKDVLATVMDLAKKLKKTAVVSGVCDGFIGNRMIEQYSRQAGFLLEEGALPRQVDAALEKWGLAMGPFRMADLAGNGVGGFIRKRRYLEKAHGQ